MNETKRKSRLPISALPLHLHPQTVEKDTLRFTLSFGLGGMATTLLILLFATGLLQLLSYSPHTASAYLSIVQMYAQGSLGGFIRNCHYWAGNFIVVIAFLHFLRVFLTGALTGARRYNWLVGMSLFCLLLFANFTGYLLPWDQLAYWAVTIFTSMLSYIPFAGNELTNLLRGAEEVGAETLSTYFAIHVGIIPGILLLLLAYHFWLIRKAGGLIRNADGITPRKRVPTTPHLLAREAAVGFGLLALLLLFSALMDAPLGEVANPGQSPNPAKAAWYFMGLQELLLHLHPSYAICVVPPLLLGFIAILPFKKDAILPGSIWFGGYKGCWVAAASIVAGVVAVTLGIILDEILLNHDTAPQAAWLMRGLLPCTFLILFITGLTVVLRRVWRCSAAEAVMGAFIFLCSSAITLSIIGIWFRGPGMALVW